MEAKIDNKGVLHIKRNGKYREAYCINNTDENCADWCAGFYEAMPGECCIEGHSNMTQIVQICCDHIFKIVADERDVKNDSNK